MFIKPKKGLLIRNPMTQAILPETGSEVRETTFWLRRLQAGDVLRAKQSSTKGKTT